MATLESTPANYSILIPEIMAGRIKIPQFQRQFVWNKITSAKLIDSILKGYPIGTFIFWQTNEQLRSIRNIGNIRLPDNHISDIIYYVLDGQQRITSIFAAIKGEIITRDDNKQEDFSKIFIDLEADPEDEIVIIDDANREEFSVISLTDLMEGSFQLLGSYPLDKQNKIKHYQGVLKGYNFNVMYLKQASINVATEVFTRLNVGGKPLSLFEIMVAKTFDSTRDFDLDEKYRKLCKDLAKANYEDIPAATVLQVVSMLLKKDVRRSTILKIDKKEFIDMWDTAVNCIKKTVDFFRGYGIVVSRLLPYPALIVPFSYFFFKHNHNPTGTVKKRLEDFFWRASLGIRYSAGVEGKLVQDVDKIDQILNDKLPSYEWNTDISLENLKKPSFGWFSTGRSIVKAILALYAIHKPKSFDSNQDIVIDNSWLKVSRSKNYHHFFPKAFMRKKYPEMNEWFYNHILNITIVDDFLNKEKIKANAPSFYMQKFIKANETIVQTMKTHLIGDFDLFGITTDNYEKFFHQRAKWVNRELKKRIISQETGHEEQMEEIEEEENGNSL